MENESINQKKAGTQILTLRMPVELKQKLERNAKRQGVSLNQMANYLLTLELSQLDSIYTLESRLSRKNIDSLKTDVTNILTKICANDVPEWDRI